MSAVGWIIVLMPYSKANAENVTSFTRSKTQFSYWTRYLWYFQSVALYRLFLCISPQSRWKFFIRHRLSADHLQMQMLSWLICLTSIAGRVHRERKDSFTYSGNPITIVAGYSDLKNGSHKENKFKEVITLVINAAISCWWDGCRWCVITASCTPARTEH